MIQLGGNIKQLRIGKGYSQSELANLLEVSQTSIAHYEAGSRQPSIETLVQIAQLFEVTVDSLVGVTQFKEESLRMDSYEIVQELIEVLLKKNSAAYWKLIEPIFELYSVKEILENIFRPILYKTGDLWQKAEITELDEHYISNIIQKSIAVLSKKNHDVIKTKDAVSFVAGSDKHTIGLEMVNTFLESEGIDVHYLGSNLTDQSLEEFINEKKPNYVFISIALESYSNNLLRFLRRINKDQTIFIGGQGIIDKKIFKDLNNVKVLDGLNDITLS